MPHKHRREERPSSSHYEQAKSTIRQAFHKPENNTNDVKNNFNFHLYNEGDRQERIDEIADDDDGDLILERQSSASTFETKSRTIEANDRRHDAVIFGDKTTEEQQKNQLWDSFKQSSKYSTTSLSGPLLLEDPETKRLRWKNKMRDLWMQRYSVKTMKNSTEMETV